MKPRPRTRQDARPGGRPAAGGESRNRARTGSGEERCRRNLEILNRPRGRRCVNERAARAAPRVGSSGGVVVLAVCWPRSSCPLPTAHAQRKEALPDDLLEVGVTEHLNEQIPLDLEFVDFKGTGGQVVGVL